MCIYKYTHMYIYICIYEPDTFWVNAPGNFIIDHKYTGKLLYTLLIFIHVNRQVLHMTRIAYIIYYMPYTLSYIPLMIYHVLYIRCYILSIAYYILYVLRWTICIVVYVIHHILNISILYVLYVVYYAYYTACATHASI